MSDTDSRLKALFALDEPAAKDPAFVLETIQMIQRRRLWLDLAGGVPVMIAVSAVFWGVTPWLELASRPLATLLAGFAPAAVLAAAALFLAAPRSHPE